MTAFPMSPPPQPLTAEEMEARGQAKETLARTSALSLNGDFSWFIETCVQAAIAEQEQKALSVESTDRQRDNAVHVRQELLRVSTWVEENLATAQNAVHSQA